MPQLLTGNYNNESLQGQGWTKQSFNKFKTNKNNKRQNKNPHGEKNNSKQKRDTGGGQISIVAQISSEKFLLAIGGL
ncbi:hypothetical protein ACQP3J_31560, partial [Escherichia coli]